MSTPTLETGRWINDLSRFSERNNARTIDIEVLTEDLGAQPEVRSMRLKGAAFDRHDERIDIMVEGVGHSHLTHSIGRVRGVEIMVAPHGMGDVLSIEHAGGRTIVRPSVPPAATHLGSSCSIGM